MVTSQASLRCNLFGVEVFQTNFQKSVHVVFAKVIIFARGLIEGTVLFSVSRQTYKLFCCVARARCHNFLLRSLRLVFLMVLPTVMLIIVFTQQIMM